MYHGSPGSRCGLWMLSLSEQVPCLAACHAHFRLKLYQWPCMGVWQLHPLAIAFSVATCCVSCFISESHRAVESTVGQLVTGMPACWGMMVVNPDKCLTSLLALCYVCVCPGIRMHIRLNLCLVMCSTCPSVWNRCQTKRLSE